MLGVDTASTEPSCKHTSLDFQVPLAMHSKTTGEEKHTITIIITIHNIFYSSVKASAKQFFTLILRNKKRIVNSPGQYCGHSHGPVGSGEGSMHFHSVVLPLPSVFFLSLSPWLTYPESSCHAHCWAGIPIQNEYSSLSPDHFSLLVKTQVCSCQYIQRLLWFPLWVLDTVSRPTFRCS